MRNQSALVSPIRDARPRQPTNELQECLVRTASRQFLDLWQSGADTMEAEIRLARSVVEDAAQLWRDPTYRHLIIGPNSEIDIYDHADDLVEIILFPGNELDGSEQRALHRFACIVIPAVEAYWRARR